ncbi:MAG: hypothetical protein ACJ72M_17385 [Propionibacteriaceae bacterium]
MSDGGRERPDEGVRFVLSAPPPLRSLAISSVAAVLAAVMIVLGSALDLPQAVAIAGIGLMVFAIALVIAALMLTARLRATAILDSTSITITQRGHRRTVPWSMIDSVKMLGSQLLLITEPEGGPNAALVNPRGSTDATFAALIADIQRRLNADRGYRPIS